MTDILLIFSQLKNIPYLLSQLDHETRSCINSFQGETLRHSIRVERLAFKAEAFGTWWWTTLSRGQLSFEVANMNWKNDIISWKKDAKVLVYTYLTIFGVYIWVLKHLCHICMDSLIDDSCFVTWRFFFNFAKTFRRKVPTFARCGTAPWRTTTTSKAVLPNSPRCGMRMRGRFFLLFFRCFSSRPGSSGNTCRVATWSPSPRTKKMETWWDVKYAKRYIWKMQHWKTFRAKMITLMDMGCRRFLNVFEDLK